MYEIQFDVFNFYYTFVSFHLVAVTAVRDYMTAK